MASVFIPLLYKRHVEYNYASCAFCRWLEKSACHINCFKCSKSKYDGCERLLPGMVANAAARLKLNEGAGVPWLFRKSCDNFCRLNKHRYLKNFSHGDFNTKIWNLEIVEGLFGGLSNGNTPCHICAAVDADIYNNCKDEIKFNEFKPCNRILNGLYKWYGVSAPSEIRVSHI